MEDEFLIYIFLGFDNMEIIVVLIVFWFFKCVVFVVISIVIFLLMFFLKICNIIDGLNCYCYNRISKVRFKI